MLSPSEIDCLRCIAGHMIPANEDHAMPSAGDATIVADMVRSLARDRDELQNLLHRVQEAAGGSLQMLSSADQTSILATLRSSQPARFAVLEAVVARSYYRDDRVLNAIGVPARAPFPAGFDVEQGDWSLLDQVRARGPIYREAD